MNVTRASATTRRRRRLWALLCGFVFLVAVALFFRNSIVQSLTEWRFNAHLKQSQELAQQGNLKSASQLALAAIQLRPDNVEACTHFFELCQETENVRGGVMVARQLCVNPDVSQEERWKFLKFLVWTRDFQGLDSVYRQMDPVHRQEREVRWIHVLWLTARGNHMEARKELEDLIAEQPESRFQLPLATLLCSADEQGDRARGRELIVELIEGREGEIALAAAKFVRRLNPLEVESRLSAAAQLCILGHEGSATEDKLFAYSLALRNLRDDREKRREVIENAIAALRDDDLYALVRWLFLGGHSARILELVAPEMAKADLGLFQVYFAALMYEQRWEDAEKWIASPPPSLALPRLESLRATLDGRQGKSSDYHWKAALNQADLDGLGKHYQMIYEMAVAEGAKDIAVDALLRWSKSPLAHTLSLAQAFPVLQYLSTAGRERDLIALLSQLAKTEPGNPTIINGLAYGQILTDESISDAVASLERLCDRYPERTAFRTSLALGYLKLNRANDAYRELTRDPLIEWSEAEDVERGIWANVLAESGSSDEAEKIRTTIDGENLSPTEKSLFLE